jgi:TolB-like protein/DNA-binding winged helix-turn-helix (wHTH) protein
MQTENPGDAVQIGEWLVDPALDIISRGTETHKLEPRMMRLLLHLANSAGAVVSVDRLLTEVWSGVVVGSASVYQAVSQLRKLLGDVDPNPTYIATVPRKGYRLIAQVVQVGTAGAPVGTASAPVSVTEPVVVPPSPTARRRRLRPLILGGAALVAIISMGWFIWTRIQPFNGWAGSTEDKSVAVLPFVDMSEKKDQEYFSDGLSEELINHLSRSHGLKVIARTSSFQFKGRNEDVRSIAGRLGVAHLLEGSVRKAGQELRVTTQLIRASDGVQLWSQTYDRNLADIFKVQDEISDRVAKALNATLAITGPIGRESDVEAYNLVLEGNYYKARQTKGNVEKAVQLYKKAIDISPSYALAWARLASAYFDLEVANGTPTAEDDAKILDALDRAIHLDPNLVWAYYTRAGYEMVIKWDWAAVRADEERMRAIDPGNTYLLPSALGDMALVSGHVAEAVEHYQREIELNPLDPFSLYAIGLALCASNRLQECLQYRLRLQQLHPDFGGADSLVGMARLYLGQLPEALDAMEKEPEKDLRLAGLALVYTAMGKRAESDAALRALEGSFASSNAYEIAQIHAYRGEADAAFEWLQRSYRTHNSKVLSVKTDPLLRSLHGDRRFKTLLAKLSLPE